MSGKLVTVFGATGRQGYPLVKGLLDKGFKVRAVTRNPDNAKAKELQVFGAEIVQVKNMESREELEKAIQGSYGVFSNTNYFGLLHENPDKPELAYDREVAQGKAIADISKKFEVNHIIYSGLISSKELSGITVPHFESKAIVAKYINEIGIPNTIVHYPFYYENLLSSQVKIVKQEDGTYTITNATQKPFHSISVSDGSLAVVSIFENPTEYLGKTIRFTADKTSGYDLATIISRVTGKTIKFNYVPPEVFATLPFPGAGDLANMFKFMNTCEIDRDPELTRKLNPAIVTFEEWAIKNKDTLKSLCA